MQNKAQIDQVLRQKCEAKEIPGVVAMAATGKEVIYQGAFGKRDLGKDDAMTADSVFWIASMTKAMTAARCSSSSRASSRSTSRSANCCPSSPRPRCSKALTPSGEPKLRPAKRPITLRHLMTHTAGFCYDMWNADMAKYLEKTGIPDITTCQNDALKMPLMIDPGTRWEYGINIDWVGKAVEAVSGKRLDAYLRDHMFAPLGMNDTGFKITDAQRRGWSACMPARPMGRWRRSRSRSSRTRNSTWAAAASSAPAPDYIKFLQMLLNKGGGNGNRVLKPETVALMGQNHIGDLNVGKLTTAAPMHQRCRSLSRHGEEMGL